ncbi:MAG: hypothetical protein IKS18_00720 [Lachnospiraceae bacterium]|nr:hypothetical protein [Lachnospiraceae bacterium]
MRYDVNRENIDANVLEAEEVIRAMNAEKGMVFVFQTHAGKERAFRCALSGDPDRDCEDAARKIKEDGAERFIAIALRLPEDLEYEYFKALNTAASRYRLKYIDLLTKTDDEDGEFIMSYRQGMSGLKSMTG